MPGVPAEIRNRPGSTTDTGLLDNWLVLSLLPADCYVESGVLVGASLRKADVLLTDAKKWAYDLSFKPLLYKKNAITYVQNDLGVEPPDRSGCSVRAAFFDDHIDPVKRIKECHAAGIEWVIFDDCPIIPNLRQYRYPAVPLVAMILDDSMPDRMIVEWHHPREEKPLRYTHDRDYCQQAKDLIVAHLDLKQSFLQVGLNCGDKVAVRLKT